MNKLIPDLDSGTLVLLVLIGVLASCKLPDGLVTSLVAVAMIVANFKWGSSQGSRDKDAVIAASTPAVPPASDKQVSL